MSGGWIIEHSELRPKAPVWLAILIIGRDVLVQAVRSLAEARNHILKSYWTGKIKFGLQMLTFVSAASVLSFGIDTAIVYWIALITLVESYYALAEFLWKNREFLSKKLI
jgi:phosphatidylglycerophosphate synthase